MIKHNIIFWLSILLMSCAELQSENINNEKMISMQSSFQEYSDKNKIEDVLDLNQNNIFDKIDTTYVVPFSVDSIYIESIKNIDEKIDSSTLSKEEVEFLTSSLKDVFPNTYLNEYLNDFYKLDSLIINKKYTEYVNQLDIGMMKACNAYINGQLNLSDELKLMLWSLNYFTYEACPYTSGTKIIGTLFYNENPISTIQLGENSGGGDAPIFWETKMYSLINTQQLKTHLVSLVGEMNEENTNEYIEFKDTTYQITISNSGFDIKPH